MLRILIVFSIVLFAGTAAAERRVALVIGDDDYRMIRKLDNAVDDARGIEAALEELGFEVTLETNRDLRRTRRALKDFRQEGKGADVALVFFAGHGVEISGDNRLLPVDADASSLDALKATSLRLEEVREAVATVANVGLIILDACRTDPFGAIGGSGRGAVAIAEAKDVRPGLGRIGKAEGILFAFSAAPGETDGDDGHSPFTEALIEYLGTGGLEVRSALTLVQQEVYDRSRGKQLPYVESGLPKLFFAATAREELPERERLLLAMADVTPDVRAEVEQIAAANDMPLAPLYGALISSDAAELGTGERGARLNEAAAAFVKVREEMKTLASADPDVARLRAEAEEQLALGTFDTARARLAEAADVDSDSRHKLKANYVERTLSEAATHYISGGAAAADLRYELAIGDLERALVLYDEADDSAFPPEHADRRLTALAELGDLYTTVGDIAAAARAFETLRLHMEKRAEGARSDPSIRRDLAIAYSKIGDSKVAQGDLPGALKAFRAGLAILEKVAAAAPNPKWLTDLAVAHDDIGDVLLTQGDLSGAIAAFKASLEVKQDLASAAPDDAKRQRDLTVVYDEIGDVLHIMG
jgi:uncharacterized caspase-like protein